jgi:hypothetical protein
VSRLTARLALLGMTACSVSQDVKSPPDVQLDGGGSLFADAVLAFSVGGQVTNCADSLGTCGQPATGACANNPALGPPDGQFFQLGANDRIEVGFLCGAIIDHPSVNGTATPDLRIHATVPNGASAVVEVSLDGSSYWALDYLKQTDQSFDLARIGISIVRFVRIADGGQGGIAIDAVEAL